MELLNIGRHKSGVDLVQRGPGSDLLLSRLRIQTDLKLTFGGWVWNHEEPKAQDAHRYANNFLFVSVPLMYEWGEEVGVRDGTKLNKSVMNIEN